VTDVHAAPGVGSVGWGVLEFSSRPGDRFMGRRYSYEPMAFFIWTERWARHVAVMSLVGLGCGSGCGMVPTVPADTDPEPTGSTSEGGTTGDGATGSVVTGDGATDSGGATDDGDDATDDGDDATDTGDDGSDATDTGDDDGCEPALDDCPDGMARGCPVDLVGTDIMADRILGLTCTPGCPGPTTALELYDSETAQHVQIAETEPGIVPGALAVAADGSVVVGGWHKPSPWEPPSAATLHRYSAVGGLMWTVQHEGASFEELVVQGDEIIGLTDDAVAAYALADGTPTWTIPLGLMPSELAVASDGTLYVRAWDGLAPFEGIHVLAFDPAHALLWDIVDAPEPDEERDFEEMIVDEAGGVILAATVTRVPETDDFIELRKLDVAGAEGWTATVDSGWVRNEEFDDAVFDVVPRVGGGVIMAGRTAESGGPQPLAMAYDVDGNPLWFELSSPTPGARLEHAVRVGDEALAMGCGDGEWMVSVSQ
jgi:hypothetical protein